MPERNLDFDKYIERRGTDCLKYDFAKKRKKPEDVLPLWVADMDFRTSSYIEDALAERVHHPIFGYTETQDAYFEIVKSWFERHHAWNIKKEWLIKTPGVVYSLAMAVKAFTRPGDAVLIQNPVYYPFSEVIKDNGRRVVSNTLIRGSDNRYHMDLDDFEKKITAENIKLFFLCSPHNPVGRVWTKEELSACGDICLKHGVIVVSDEIHQDFVFKGKHHVFTSVKKEFEDISVIATSPSKTFNLAGLMLSNVFIPNPELKKQYRAQIDASGISQLGTLGITACEAAYTSGDEWYNALLAYLKSNLEWSKEYVEKNLPGVTMTDIEGTYLIWLDFNGTGKTPVQINDLIINKAKLWLDAGEIFGKSGAGFQRVNAACRRNTLLEAFERIRMAFYE